MMKFFPIFFNKRNAALSHLFHLAASFISIHFKIFKYCISVGVSGSQEKWVESLKHIALFAKLENGHLNLKFDEIGALSFGLKIPEILSTAGFQNFTLDVLATFFLG